MRNPAPAVLALLVTLAGPMRPSPAEADPAPSWWNGFSGSGLTGCVHALDEYDGALCAGGVFLRVGDVVQSPHIARWDGHAWSAMGSGTNGVVRVLGVYRGELWAGGEFDRAGGPGPVHALRPSGLDLAAGGAFSQATGWTQEHIAVAERLQTPTRSNPWVSLDSGVNGDVYALAADGPLLYAGGCFTSAGGHDSPGVARWGEAATTGASGVPGPPRLLSAWPNPFSREIRIRLASCIPASAELAVYDIHGRPVANLFGGPVNGSSDEPRWDARDAAGQRLSAGVYFLRLSTPGSVETRKILLLP